jgi:quercetin 2,3-dioxygenase
MSLRPIKRLIKSKPTIEGAGVHLRRAFGFGTTSDFDPFLLLDDFRNDVPQDYLAGFPCARSARFVHCTALHRTPNRCSP